MTPDPRYPIGKFTYTRGSSEEERTRLIDTIAALPEALRTAVEPLSGEQQDTPYREDGWTVRQLVHHVADSHMNAYCRLRLAMTEENPVIRPYEEGLWANLPDASGAPVGVSLILLDALHDRWVRLWRALQPSDFDRLFTHPEHGQRNVEWLLKIYAWHGRHHVAHVMELRKRRHW